jgi:uncharacterized membrane protein
MQAPSHPCCVCASCGTEQPGAVSSVVWFSETSVTLAKCGHCGQPLDAYVEYEPALVSIDLMLHRVPAYRHVIRNSSLRDAVWLRFALVLFWMGVLSELWTAQPVGVNFAASSLRASLELAGQACGAMLAYRVAGGSWRERQILMKALLVGRAPQAMLIIAWTWGYPATFKAVINVYGACVRPRGGFTRTVFTATVAAIQALPLQSRVPTAMFVAGTSVGFAMAGRVLADLLWGALPFV